ncbi:MAG UNVERIFIED_CONTAM: hypothetical protein LVR18_50805 [Planctomycetaceae bacterium]|jgi:hypothetical protein
MAGGQSATACRWPNGDWARELFAQKLEHTLNAGVTADQVLADAEQEYERGSKRTLHRGTTTVVIAFPGKVLPPDDAAGRRETVRRVIASVSEEHGAPETLVATPEPAWSRFEPSFGIATFCGCQSRTAVRLLKCPSFDGEIRWPAPRGLLCRWIRAA